MSAETLLPSSAPSQTLTSVRAGLPIGNLDDLILALEVDRPFLLSVLGISERTMQRRQHGSGRLSPMASDRLARIRRIYALASEVFDTSEKAVKWLKRPSRALGNEAPILLLDTDAGTQLVERELRQIQFGFVF